MVYTGVFIKQALFFFLFIIKTILCIHKKNYTPCKALSFQPLQWRHNDHDIVSNHQPQGCLLNHLFGHRSKKTSKLRVTGLCVGNSPGPVNSLHKRPVTRKMFPFDDVIMIKFNFNKDVNYPLYITATLESRSMQFSIRAIHLYIYMYNLSVPGISQAITRSNVINWLFNGVQVKARNQEVITLSIKIDLKIPSSLQLSWIKNVKYYINVLTWATTRGIVVPETIPCTQTNCLIYTDLGIVLRASKKLGQHCFR